MKYLRLLFIPLLVTAAALPVRAEKIVIGEGWAQLGDDTTPAVAKATALNNARRDALEQGVGVAVRGTSVVYNFELIRDLVTTATKGVITKEELLENKCETGDGKIACTARIRAVVKPLDLDRRGDFRIVKAAVLRSGSERSMAVPVFQHGDEIQVRAKANKDIFMNVFGVDQYGNILKLYPNKVARGRLVLSGDDFVFPTSEQMAAGVHLRVKTPAGLTRAIESVLFIATTSPVNLLEDKPIENATLSDLMMELSRLSPSVWTDKTLGYEVRN